MIEVTLTALQSLATLGLPIIGAALIIFALVEFTEHLAHRSKKVGQCSK